MTTILDVSMPGSASEFHAFANKKDLFIHGFNFLFQFHTVPVNHVPNSYGVSITHKSGWKLVYSGDTTPCQRLVEAGLYELIVTTTV